MIDHVERRFLSFFLAILLVVLLLPLDALAVELFSETVLDGKVKVHGDGTSGLGSGSNDNGTITITSKAGSTCNKTSWGYSATDHTIYIENVSNETLNLKFTYSASGLGALTIDGVNKTATTSGMVPKTLAPGDKVTIVLTSPASGTSPKNPMDSGANSATLALSNFELADPNARKVTVKPGTNGTVSVNGAAISADKEVSTTYTTGVAVSATPAANYEFVAWRDANDNVLSTIAGSTIYPESDLTVSALFVQKNSAAHWLAGGKVYADLTAACTAAQAGDKLVVLLNNGTLSGTHTIPEGITVLIPYSDEHIVGGEDPEVVQIPEPLDRNYTCYLFRKLTMADGANLTVNGALELGAKHYCSHGGGYIGGTPVAGYGQIDMKGDSAITVNGKLYAWGYITGTGSVTAESGATIYEKMQVTDYRGGSITTLGLVPKNIFPFNQYYIQNVEVRETIKAGALLICHAGVFADAVQKSSVSFMGTGGMFQLTSGSATKYYDASTDRLTIDVEGNISMNSISLEFAGKTYDTTNYKLPLNNNITINILDKSNATIAQHLLLLPGAEVNVANGATLTLSKDKSVYIFDKDNWGSYCFNATMRQLRFVGCRSGAPVSRSLSDAKLNINGELILNGKLYTSSAGAQIISPEESGSILFNTAAPTSNEEVLQSTAWQGIADATKREPITMVPALLTNGEGVEPATYDTKGKAAGTKVHYCADCDKWGETITVTFDANGGTGTMADMKTHAGCGATLPAADALTAPEGMTFAGWNTVAAPTEENPGTAYEVGTKLSDTTITADITLYAQWESANIKVTTVKEGVISYAVSGQTVTVNHNIACKVGYWDATTSKYVAIKNPVANADGSYSFTADDGITEVLLVIKGDANVDGMIKPADAMLINAHYLKRQTLSAQLQFACDVNGDGNILPADAMLVNANYLGRNALAWG